MLPSGSSIPTLDVAHPDGTAVDNADIVSSGAPTLLVFFKVGCPTCQLTLPFLNRFEDRLRVIGISQDERNATERFREQYGIRYPLLLDEKRKGYPTSNAFDITNVPSLFLVDGAGKIEWSDNGFSKPALTRLGERFAVRIFEAAGRVPEFKPG